MPLRRNSATFANWISYAFWLAPCFITSLIACTLMTSVRSLFEIEWWFGKIGWVHNGGITPWLYFKKKEICRKFCIISNSKITLIYSLCWLQVSHVWNVLYLVAIYNCSSSSGICCSKKHILCQIIILNVEAVIYYREISIKVYKIWCPSHLSVKY